MKKGHPFMFKFRPQSTTVEVEKGKIIGIDGKEEIIHSVHSIKSEHPYIVVLGFLAKREESE